jgi:hypothetical protein
MLDIRHQRLTGPLPGILCLLNSFANGNSGLFNKGTCMFLG